jgi:hypothetical protein
MNTPPPTLPPDNKPTRHVARLRDVICAYLSASANAIERQRFADILDLLNGQGDTPHGHLNGRADHATCPAIIQARMLQAIRMIREKAVVKDLEPVVAWIEWAGCMAAGTYRIIGSRGEGYTMEPVGWDTQ